MNAIGLTDCGWKWTGFYGVCFVGSPERITFSPKIQTSPVHSSPTSASVKAPEDNDSTSSIAQQTQNQEEEKNMVYINARLRYDFSLSLSFWRMRLFAHEHNPCS